MAARQEKVVPAGVAARVVVRAFYGPRRGASKRTPGSELDPDPPGELRPKGLPLRVVQFDPDQLQLLQRGEVRRAGQRLSPRRADRVAVERQLADRAQPR